MDPESTRDSGELLLPSSRRLRLGVWGLGRGLHLSRNLRQLPVDLVAACDMNPQLQDACRGQFPSVQVTADAEEFLSWDFEAVIVSTFCPDHAKDALRALQSGKHVLSEVTAFHTCAEGVALVEAVEKSGLVYQLAENYPFTPPNLYLADLWQEGYFGELMYAEYSYIHDCLNFAYTRTDGVPLQPGSSVHSWRSWLPWHHYCSHSLGPVMHITGERPARVTALPGKVRLPGHLLEPPEGLSGMAPSLVEFANGGLMRNLMGSGTMDGDVQRIYGSRGAAEIREGKLFLCPSGRGLGPKLSVQPLRRDALGQQASLSGHGGADFWVVYHFANEILNGVSGPFDVYRAADVTLVGIQAYRSAKTGGVVQEIPDFRKACDRDRFRSDDFSPERPETTTLAFSREKDAPATQCFTTVMRDLLEASTRVTTAHQAAHVVQDLDQPEEAIAAWDRLLDRHGFVTGALQAARVLVTQFPASRGSAALVEILESLPAGWSVSPPSRLSCMQEREKLVDFLPPWQPGEEDSRPGLPQLQMRLQDLENLPALTLPDGYSLRCGRGEMDGPLWCRIVGLAFGEEKTTEDYRRSILKYPGYAPDRLFFIMNPEGGECAVAGGFGAGEEGYVHYVAVLPSHTGKRLGFFVTLAVLHSMAERGCAGAWLKTDDHRLPAIKTYHRLGFRPMVTHRSHPVRWELLKRQANLL